MAYDITKLPAKQVLGLAKNFSGKSNVEIAEAIEQDKSSVKRYFNENDIEYFPSLLRIPGLCLALGNTFLLDWLQAQVEENQQTSDIRSDTDLLHRMNRLAAELGDVHRSVENTLSETNRDNFQSERLMSELYKMEQRLREFRKSLQRITGGSLDSEGWTEAVVRGE